VAAPGEKGGVQKAITASPTYLSTMPLRSRMTRVTALK
jgi:hypothetical protein